MGKMHDRFKGRDMKQGAVITSRDLAGATVVQQLGLDTPHGMQRMLSILIHKLDPESKGVVLTLEDLQRYGEVAVQRQSIMVRGHFDSVLFKLCTDEEMANAEAHAAAIFRAAGLGNVQ